MENKAIMDKLKLLYVSTSLWSYHEYRFLKLLSEDKSIELAVATLDPDIIHPEIRKLDLQRLYNPRILKAISMAPDIIRKKYNNYLFFILIKSLIRKFKPDIIHSGWLTFDSYLALLTGFHPVLAMSWGSDVLNNEFIENPHNSSRLLKRLKYVAKKADAIYSDASVVGETIVSLTGAGENKIHIFPQIGVDVSRFNQNPERRQEIRRRHGVSESTRILLCVRNYLPVYAVDTLLKAMTHVLKDHADTILFSAGEGPLRKNLEELVVELGLRDKVRILGPIPNNELPAYYNASDLYISTSLSDGTSLALLEAISSGLPVMVTDVPANLEWIKEGYNGWIAGRGDVGSIASKISGALSSPKDMVDFGKRNRDMAMEKIDMGENYLRLKRIYIDQIRINKYQLKD